VDREGGAADGGESVVEGGEKGALGRDNDHSDWGTQSKQ